MPAHSRFPRASSRFLACFPSLLVSFSVQARRFPSVLVAGCRDPPSLRTPSLRTGRVGLPPSLRTGRVGLPAPPPIRPRRQLPSVHSTALVCPTAPNSLHPRRRLPSMDEDTSSPPSAGCLFESELFPSLLVVGSPPSTVCPAYAANGFLQG
ncbi:hypothetical protein GQ55_6G252500 [Panicum hallii var. hallii]|uniref:Secreted protein n=1 Tax=Panicum hallii var. hallii TaxID=1504633 RepID=A0A2T7D9F8_9POAL|nr:hypothetical protein GQ55_6G252500 [Panicum hallii var. hallii]